MNSGTISSGHQAPPRGASDSDRRRTKPSGLAFALHPGGQGKGKGSDAEDEGCHDREQCKGVAAEIHAGGCADGENDEVLNHAEGKIDADFGAEELGTGEWEGHQALEGPLTALA